MAYAEKPRSVNDHCPLCCRHHAARCRCPLGDMTCPNGHSWHACPGCRRPVVGPASHARGADDRCGRCKAGG